MKGPLGLVDVDSILGRMRGDVNGLLPRIVSRAVSEGVAEIVERGVEAVLKGGLLTGPRGRP